MSERVAVFAEAFLHTSNGKAAHGLIRYGEREVVAVVDSLHAGRTVDEIVPYAAKPVPIVATVAEAADARRAVPRHRRRARRRQAAARVEGGAARGARARAARRGGAARRARPRPRSRRRGRRARARAARSEARAAADSRRRPAPGSAWTARIVHTVGTDCAIGKMTVTLELAAAASAGGRRAVFVPTGQVGISIAGWGIAVDHVISDYVAGAAERLVLEGAERGDVLLVEGQGAILHPLYSGRHTRPAARLHAARARARARGRCRSHRPRGPRRPARPRDPAARRALGAAAAADHSDATRTRRRDRALDQSDRERRRCPRGDRGGRSARRAGLRRSGALRHRAVMARGRERRSS